MIEQIIITSFTIWAFFALTRVKFSVAENKFTQKSPLWFIKWYGDKWIHRDLALLIYDCPKCQAWLWTIITSLIFGFSWITILVATSVCGINYVLLRLFPYSDD
jgi:hypothetical protein